MEYSLKYDNLEVVVNSHGAELEHIYCNGIDYMRKRDEFWNRKSPVLFPIVGKLRDLKTFIDGNEYHMNQHGFARDMEFELVEEKENKLVFLCKSNLDTLKMYPYQFELYIEYVINNKNLDVIYKIKTDIALEQFKNLTETEINPIVGTEQQSEELVKYMLKEFEAEPSKIWNSNMFGKSLYELVNEGLHTKLDNMPSDARRKLGETLEKIVNEGTGGLICILL